MNIDKLKTETPHNKRKSVTVLGLGNMGAASEPAKLSYYSVVSQPFLMPELLGKQ